MADREKIISNLKGVYEYLRHFENTAKMGEWVADAIELLKEQEATVSPFHKCIGSAHTIIEDRAFDFCPYCGRAVKWE